MKSDNGARKPFRLLGKSLKQTRELRHESIAEASGAVEIDLEILASIERGEQRPSEEILLLLISHFEVEDEMATDLWDMAGYGEANANIGETGFDMSDNIRQTAFVLPMDIRVVYTDMVHVMVNNYGVVMNFIQNSGPNSQPLAVARVGMSREHAESVIKILQQTLAQADQTNQPTKSLPASAKTKSRKTDK